MDNTTIAGDIESICSGSRRTSYPDTPFENIGFALSGGGFRAAAYGLGVMSLMDYIKLPGKVSEESQVSLLDKVRFISSASGGTITLSVYAACVHNNVPFKDFYKHLNKELTGEDLLHKAIDLLKDDNAWQNTGKSRNLINAFAKAYHEKLFSIIPEADRTIGTLMRPSSVAHIEEVCFNSTDFYTGISFRFQATEEWEHRKGGTFGNNNISINFGDKEIAVPILQKIRLADVLAASSCFPLGFEPIIFPQDFSYKNGPATEELKKAMLLKTYSWNDKKTDEENKRSKRATNEKEFASQGQFGLMDGGICDNQGLFSLLQANERKSGEKNDDDDETTEQGNIIKNRSGNRFDLLMVSDVTSFYMSPYKVPAINTSQKFLQKTPNDYWASARKIWAKIPGYILWTRIAAIVFCLLTLSPLTWEGVHFSTVSLGLIGLIILMIVFVVTSKFKKLTGNGTTANQIMQQPALPALLKHFLPKDTFTNRMAIKVSEYMQDVKLGVIVQMGNARVLSAVTMISEVFLKHIRRLIYDSMFTDINLYYRRLDNVIYKLSYTNDKTRQRHPFDIKAGEDNRLYDQRKAVFHKEMEERCIMTAEMQRIAELAYNTGTTLWFEQEQETGTDNNRKALIATGQFTTCYNLLGYALSLKHSRYYKDLDEQYRIRIELVVDQLTTLMKKFEADPFFLYKEYEK